MFCTNCGKELPDNARFCTDCGAKVELPEGHVTADAAGVPAQQPEQATAEAAVGGAAAEETAGVPAGEQPEAQTPTDGSTPGEAQGPTERPEAEAPGEPYTAQDLPSVGSGAEEAEKQPAASPAPQDAADFSADQSVQQSAVAVMDPPVPPAALPEGFQYPQAAPPKRRRTGLWITLGIVLLVLVMALVLLIGPIAAALNPQRAVANAAEKTFEQLSQQLESASAQLGLGEIFGDGERPVQQDIHFSLVPNDGSGERMDLNLGVRSDTPARRIMANVDIAFMDESVGFNLYALDDVLALGSQDLFGSEILAIHTETLGYDINRSVFGGYSGIDVEDDLGFNLFERAEEPAEEFLTPETKEAIEELGQALKDETVYKKVGKQDVSVNGSSRSTTHYTVTIPEDVFKSTVKGMMRAVLYDENFLLAMQANPTTFYAGYGPELYEIEDQMDKVYDMLCELLSYIDGDVAYDVYISGGTVVKLSSEILMTDGVDDVAMHFNLELGGKNNLIDAVYIGLLVESGGEEVGIELTSEGRHMPADGVFSDETTLKIHDGIETVSIGMSTEYDTKKSSDNLDMVFFVINSDENTRLSLAASVEASPSDRTLNAEINELKLNGSDLSALGEYALRYSIAPYEEGENDFPDPDEMTYVLALDETQLKELQNRILMTLYSRYGSTTW